MARSLKQNLTSAYLGASSKMAPKRQRRRIIAFVESYDDIAFWRTLLDDFETDEFYFQIMLPSHKSLTKGKKQVLMNLLDSKGLGNNLIACVDSDYDYLLQDANKQSRLLNTHPYILHTYAYAIENFQCYADALHEVCVQATLNDRVIIDFPAFMNSYSQIVYPLFLWHLWFTRQGNSKLFPMGEMSACTCIQEIDIHQPERTLNQIEKRVRNQLTRLEKRYAAQQEKVKHFGKELEDLGLKPECTYLYMQGHHIFEHVALKLLTPVCTALRREREREIKQLAVHHQQYKNELSCYENSLTSPAFMLKKHTSFKDMELYQRIQQDIARMMKQK